MMTTSELGKNQIRQHEGLRLTAYDDGAGNLTIGYGHKMTGATPHKITREQAEELFAADVATAEAAVNRFVRVPLTSAQFDALVSLVFNWGAGNFSQSELLRRLNAGDYRGAQQRLLEHPVTAGGVVLPGLQQRRRAEADWFGREGFYTLEELAASGYDVRTIDGQPQAATPEPETVTLAVPGTTGEAPGKWTWLIIGGLLLVAVIAFSD